VPELLIAALLLGFSAGLAPGPLMALVIMQTLRHGVGDGIRVALAPLLTDTPIIVLALTLVAYLADFPLALPLLSILGGVVVMGLALEGFRAELPDTPTATGALSRGVIVNFLNPQPWLFWFSIGGPMLVAANARFGLSAPGAFLVVFYGLLVGLKVAMAVLLGRYRGRLGAAWYRRIMRGLSVLLAMFAIWLLTDGLGVVASVLVG
jgi:threonine/homoserine/homoserine lactone efflux protein